MEHYDGLLTLYQQSDARSERSSGSNITKEEAAERAEGSMDSDSVYDLLEEEEELEHERWEQERREQERWEQERLEQERLEKERLEQERVQRQLEE
jgi:hypothetical protein